MTRVLAVRLDSVGDVLLTGPAIRALAHGSERVDLLASPLGADAAALLPGVHEVLIHDPAWSGPDPAPLDRAAWEAHVTTLQERAYDLAVIFTSFHQSALPAALACRLAGIPRVVGTSDDYPGSLLDVRHRRRTDGRDDDGGPDGGHEVEASLRVAAAAGFGLAPEEDTRLAVRVPSGHTDGPPPPYVVVHPGAAAATRSIPAPLARGTVSALVAAGHRVVVTGGAAERATNRAVAGDDADDLTGRTDLTGLAGVLRDADVLVAGNTGPAHLAAAVGTPVVSVFAPVVPAARWRPWGVPVEILGDQAAPCAHSRARTCPTPGHPCVTDIPVGDVVAAVGRLSSVVLQESSRCAS